VARWPDAADWPEDADAERDMAWVMQVILAVRQIRGEMDISPAKRLPLLLQDPAALDLDMVRRHGALLARLGGIEAPQVLAAGAAAPPAAAATVGEMTLLVPMAGLIDPAAERARLEKRIGKLNEEIGRANAKLGNDNFVRSAPEAVVAQEHARLADFQRSLAALERQLAQVRALQA
jgi:valyl-tRNA synthetase